MFPSVRFIYSVVGSKSSRNKGTCIRLFFLFSFCAIQWVLWKCYKTVCVVFLWFKRWNVYHKIVIIYRENEYIEE